MVRARTKTPVKKAKVPPASEDLRAEIIAVARRHFSLLGYQGASLKDIAKDARVANSLINYHFNGKEGLFRACLEVFVHQQLASINRILGEVKNRDELRVRLELFVGGMLQQMTEDSSTFEIIDREMRAENPMVQKIFQETLLLAFKNVVQFFKKAQETGVLKKSLDPMMIAGLLFASTCDVTRKDYIAKKYFDLSFFNEKTRKRLGETIVELFMNGVVE